MRNGSIGVVIVESGMTTTISIVISIGKKVGTNVKTAAR